MIIVEQKFQQITYFQQLTKQTQSHQHAQFVFGRRGSKVQILSLRPYKQGLNQYKRLLSSFVEKWTPETGQSLRDKSLSII